MLYTCRYFILFVVAVWWFYYMVKDEYNRLLVDPVYIYKNEDINLPKNKSTQKTNLPKNKYTKKTNLLKNKFTKKTNKKQIY